MPVSAPRRHDARVKRPVLPALVLVLVAVLLPALGSPPGVATPSRAARQPSVSPPTAVAGEKVTVRLALPTRFARPTVLQRQQGRRWVRVATQRSTARGTVTYRITAKKLTVRVFAPATRRAGRPVAAYTSRPRTVTPRISRSRLIVRAEGGGVPTNGAEAPSVSADGRFVAFTSRSADIAPGGSSDYGVFLTDTKLNTTRLISRGATTPDGASISPDITPDGRVVVFASTSTNLVPGDTNGLGDVFLWRRGAGLSLVSVDAGGGPSNGASDQPSVSADGRYVAYSTSATDAVSGDATTTPDVVVREPATNVTRLVSHTPGGSGGSETSSFPVISDDGRVVVFDSFASDLTPDTNGTVDVFVWQRSSDVVTRISRAPGGGAADSASFDADLSADGRRIVFSSVASNLVAGTTNTTQNVYLHDRRSGRTSVVSVDRRGRTSREVAGAASISADGATVAFTGQSSRLVAGDTNATGDIFVRFLRSGINVRASVSVFGRQGSGGRTDNADLAGNGRFVVFASEFTNLVSNDTNGQSDVFSTDLRAVPPR